MRPRTGAGAVPEISCASFEQFKRELVEPRLSRNNGRLIKTTGDGASDEFASPLAAVTSAMETRPSLPRDVATQQLRPHLDTVRSSSKCAFSNQLIWFSSYSGGRSRRVLASVPGIRLWRGQ